MAAAFLIFWSWSRLILTSTSATRSTTATASRSTSTLDTEVAAAAPLEWRTAAYIPFQITDRGWLTHLQLVDRWAPGPAPASRAGQATKYLAWGWWQMMAVVDCSGWSWNPSETSTPMRSAPSSSTTLALSSSSGQAG